MRLAYVVSRYAISFLIITYGFAKLNGAQFTVLESELDKPMGEVSGFWLTWYYFGYSKVYGDLVALAQVLGGLLLVFRRTTLLGACLLLPIVTNIVLIDVFYGIDPGALFVALLIGAGLLVILAAHRRELTELLWTRQNHPFPSGRSTRIVPVGKLAACALLVVVPAAFTYWVANFNNRVPTPVDGAWEVVEVSRGSGAFDAPSAIFFERNRAHMCVFRYGEGSGARYEQHHFEVHPGTRSIAIWQTWSQKGPKIFDGRYELPGTRLRLTGMLTDRPQELDIVLRRRE